MGPVTSRAGGVVVAVFVVLVVVIEGMPLNIGLADPDEGSGIVVGA
jgi:fumarate reductase subunit D